MLRSFALILALISLDQYSKYWVESNLGQPLNLIPGFIELRYSQNTGIAFSLLEDFPLILTILNSLIVLIIVFYFIKEYVKLHGFKYFALLLLISGGIGNLLDRFTKGYIVDFINPTFIDFAIFNLADSFLNIGVFLLILDILFSKGDKA